MPSSFRSCDMKVPMMTLTSGRKVWSLHSLALGLPNITPPHLGDMKAWTGDDTFRSEKDLIFILPVYMSKGYFLLVLKMKRNLNYRSSTNSNTVVPFQCYNTIEFQND